MLLQREELPKLREAFQTQTQLFVQIPDHFPLSFVPHRCCQCIIEFCRPNRKARNELEHKSATALAHHSTTGANPTIIFRTQDPIDNLSNNLQEFGFPSMSI